jgi:hypothetical protein
VTGSVELWNHSNPSNTSVLDDFPHVTLFVNFRDGMVSAFFTANDTTAERISIALFYSPQLGVGVTHVRKTRIVDDMPVQNVEFVVSHGVQILQDDVDGLEMPRSVQEKSSMGEFREVGNDGGIDNELQEI